MERVASELDAMQGTEKEHNREFLLLQGVRFAFRVHQVYNYLKFIYQQYEHLQVHQRVESRTYRSPFYSLLEASTRTAWKFLRSWGARWAHRHPLRRHRKHNTESGFHASLLWSVYSDGRISWLAKLYKRENCKFQCCLVYVKSTGSDYTTRIPVFVQVCLSGYIFVTGQFVKSEPQSWDA
jgi:hypothetical protein